VAVYDRDVHEDILSRPCRIGAPFTLPIPEFRWERVSVDLITHLPPIKQGHTIVLFVDALSKIVHFTPAWDDMGGEEFANSKYFWRIFSAATGFPNRLYLIENQIWRPHFSPLSAPCWGFSSAWVPPFIPSLMVKLNGLTALLRACYGILWVPQLHETEWTSWFKKIIATGSKPSGLWVRVWGKGGWILQ
jgi:hypothetical protein